MVASTGFDLLDDLQVRPVKEATDGSQALRVQRAVEHPGVSPCVKREE